MDSSSSYLIELTTRLASGLKFLPVDEREAYLKFFLSQQENDGGFRGRGDQSDLYYTAFALRGLAVLGCEDEQPLHHAAEYLRSKFKTQVGIIDLISLVLAGRLLEAWLGISLFPKKDSDWQRSLAKLLQQLRRPDGGYAKTVEGHASSTYQTFLVALVCQLLELPLPDPHPVIEFILAQQREDGGFVEMGVMRRSGTNPTAAAVAALRILQSDLPPSTLTDQVTQFLVNNQTSEGGLRANTQIPIADLLSTYTGLQTLHHLGNADRLNRRQEVTQYVISMRQESGGFLAAAWDEVTDVEYTFYGVATLGLVLSEENR